jgi:pentatricopeptide repeat protein
MFYFVIYSTIFVIVLVFIIKYKHSHSFEQQLNLLVNSFLSKQHSKNVDFNFSKEISLLKEQYILKGNEITINMNNLILKAFITLHLIEDACVYFQNMNQNEQINDETIYLFFKALITDNRYIETHDASHWVIILENSLHKGSSLNINKINEYKDLIIIGKVFEQKSVEAYERFILYMNDAKDVSFKIYENKMSIPFLCGILSYTKNNEAISTLANSLPLNQFIPLSKEIIEIIIKACIKSKSFTLIEQLVMNYQSNSSFIIKCIDCLIEALSKSPNQNAYELCEMLFNKYQSFISISSYGIMMSMYSKTSSYEKCLKLFNHIKTHKSNELSIIPYQIIIKTLINNNNLSQAVDIFDKMGNEDNIYPDKMLYELVIKMCCKHKMVKRAYDYLLMSINHNIKLSKFIYEDVIDALNSSDLFDKESLLNEINDLIKVSNFQHDKSLMKKLKIIVEKENSFSSLETRTSFIAGKPLIELLNE